MPWKKIIDQVCIFQEKNLRNWSHTVPWSTDLRKPHQALSALPLSHLDQTLCPSWPQFPQLWNIVKCIAVAYCILYGRSYAMHFACMISVDQQPYEVGTLSFPLYRLINWGSDVTSLVVRWPDVTAHIMPHYTVACDLKGKIFWHIGKKWLGIKHK